MRPASFSAFRTGLLGVIFFSLAMRVEASTGVDVFTLNLPAQAAQVTPVWLGHPVLTVGTFATLDLPLTAPEINESLLVTIVFQEKPGGFLRLAWRNADGEQLLSSNFYEGVGMANKRTLLIPSSIIQDMGTLSLQSGQASLDVSQIRFEWLEGGVALVAPGQTDQTVVTQLGTVAKASTLDGQPATVPVADVDGNLITVPITNSPQHIEQGVEFSLQLDGTPKAARLTLQESGLPWSQHLVIWVNQQRAATASPIVPDLEEAGFATPPDALKPFIGWRDVTAYLPVALMKAGINTLQISAESDTVPADGTGDDDAMSQQPLAVNNLSCQFDYTSLPTAAVTAASPAPTIPPAVIAPASTVPEAPSLSSELKTGDAPAAPTTTPASKPVSTPDYLNTTVP